MIYIEGADAVGKTCTIEGLSKYGIYCIDREKSVFSKNMVFNISMEERVKRYFDYLSSHDDIIIFMVNNDEDELMRRIYAREIIDQYDLDTCKYNKLYVDTYNYMKDNDMLCGKLFLVDCTYVNLEEQINKVREVVEGINAKYCKSLCRSK